MTAGLVETPSLKDGTFSLGGSSPTDGQDRFAAAHLALLSLFFAVLVRTASMYDDAEITLRCVMNFIHGYGPTFNIDERVQPFTHPLWFLLISALTLLLRNVFAATFGLSIVLSLATFWLLMKRLAASPWPGMLAGAGLLMSKAFVDYSTSGLENPLSSFLLVVGLMFGFRCLESKDDYRSAAVCLTVLMLSYLGGPDLVLLVLPFCLLVLCTYSRTPREAARLVTIAVAPEVLWTMFSLLLWSAVPQYRVCEARTRDPHNGEHSAGAAVPSRFALTGSDNPDVYHTRDTPRPA